MEPEIVECPHCYTRVLPNRAGTCPSCGRDIADTTGVDPTRTSLSIETNSALPPVCCMCARATDRYVAIVAARAGAKDDEASELFVMQIFALVLRKLRTSRNDRPEVSVQLPQCDHCGVTHGRPKPRAISYERAVMVFEVHRDFRRAFEAELE